MVREADEGNGLRERKDRTALRRIEEGATTTDGGGDGRRWLFGAWREWWLQVAVMVAVVVLVVRDPPHFGWHGSHPTGERGWAQEPGH
ncbi:hypothetical protein EDC01DRAFT_790062 [Geopyxis carbonaria]|nr:hypothetical protein EDC01DRAFT_790062 [Geopyxis carbonaria]